MESKHTYVHGDDHLGKMNDCFKPINLNRSVAQEKLSSLQIDFNETSILESDSVVGCEIRVLLVDGDKESLISTARILALNSYQVTMVVSGSIAMKTISAGKKQFDMVIIDVDLPDMDSFQLCKKINDTGILVVVTSTKDDPEVTYKALDNGAYILIKKPVDELSMKYLHQFMIKQRIQKSRKEMDREIGSVENISCDGMLVIESTNEDVVGKKRKYHRKNGTKEGANDVNNPPNLNLEPSSVEFYNKKKMCIEWTKELHKKFMDAVNQLGEGNCYPKEILELMNVSGLTRMQVASHLQKCRYDNWRSPTERKKQSRMRKYSAPTTIVERAHEKTRVFGSMPHVYHKSEEKVQRSPHYVSLPLFGSKPAEKLNILGSGNGILSNFNTPLTYFPDKENALERWMEHIDPIEGTSLMWATQGVRIPNSTSHPWTLPPPTFNSVPTIAGDNNISTSYNSIHMAGNDVGQTKEALDGNTNSVPTLKMPDVMTGELFPTGDEEMNFLLPEFPNFALEKSENCEFNHRYEVNNLQWIENRANEATGHLGNATMASTSARRVIKDL